MPDLPSGTVTFLFTDIEGSTACWERDRVAMEVAVERHIVLLDAAIQGYGGIHFKTVGDAVQAAFPTAPQAVAAAVDGQRALLDEAWGEIGPLKVRMAVHAGEAIPDARGDYLAAPLNRLSRLLSTGYGGQILLSQTVQQLTRGALPFAVELRDLGEHRLRDLLEPERVFQLLYPDLPAEFPPLKSLDYRPHNLPPQLTPLVGRDEEVSAIAALVSQHDVRLVTLTGPGGTGKTRLALAVAAELINHFPDGVWFVDLAPLPDPMLVLPTIAATLGVREAGVQSIQEALAGFLASKRLLLVVDNFEHVLEAAPVVSDLLASGPAVTALITSREALRLRGEREVAVAPLATPDITHLPNLEELSRIPAVTLFIQRAQAVHAGFVLTNDNAAAVAAISHRLDGLPLAIELAAARIKLLPPAALLTRLERSLPLLTSGARDAPARQRTLRDTIDWSHKLLSTDDQTVFRRLGVFSGGATLEAAEAVANLDRNLDVLSALGSLIDKSLVRQVEQADGEPRFTMLETIREFALDQLDSTGEQRMTHQAHAAYVCHLVEVAEPELIGPDQEVWLNRLDAELDNLRAALAWSLDTKDADTAQRLAGASYDYWDIRGFYSEARSWLESALDGTAPSRERAKALQAVGTVAFWQGDADRAWALNQESLAVARAFGDDKWAAYALQMLGNVALRWGDHTRAVELQGEALTLFRNLGDARGVAATLSNLASAVYSAGDAARATELQEQVLVMARKNQDTRAIAVSLLNLATLARERGERRIALSLTQEGLDLARDLRDNSGIAEALARLGELANDDDDGSRAAQFLHEALDLVRQLGQKEFGVWLIEQLARTAMLANQAEQGCHLLGAAEALRETLKVPGEQIEQHENARTVTAVRSRLDEKAFADAWASGRALSWDQAMVKATLLAEELASNPD